MAGGMRAVVRAGTDALPANRETAEATAAMLTEAIIRIAARAQLASALTGPRRGRRE
jgi:hypothetical protein